MYKVFLHRAKSSTRQLPLAMWPELCSSATEMALQIIPGLAKRIQELHFFNLKNSKRVISVNSGVTWVLGISLLATTGPVRNSSLSKGKAEEISNTANRTRINFPFL